MCNHGRWENVHGYIYTRQCVCVCACAKKVSFVKRVVSPSHGSSLEMNMVQSKVQLAIVILYSSILPSREFQVSRLPEWVSMIGSNIINCEQRMILDLARRSTSSSIKTFAWYQAKNRDPTQEQEKKKKKPHRHHLRQHRRSKSC